MFHAGVYVLQGIDFMGYWCLSLVVFIPDALAFAFGATPEATQWWEGGATPALIAAFSWLAAMAAASIIGLDSPPFIALPMFARCVKLTDFASSHSKTGLVFGIHHDELSNGIDCGHAAQHILRSHNPHHLIRLLPDKVVLGYVGPPPHNGPLGGVVYGVVCSNVDTATTSLEASFSSFLQRLASLTEGEQWDPIKMGRILQDVEYCHFLMKQSRLLDAGEVWRASSGETVAECARGEKGGTRSSGCSAPTRKRKSTAEGADIPHVQSGLHVMRFQDNRYLSFSGRPTQIQSLNALPLTLKCWHYSGAIF